jgi:hypothetical protein
MYVYMQGSMGCSYLSIGSDVWLKMSSVAHISYIYILVMIGAAARGYLNL